MKETGAGSGKFDICALIKIIVHVSMIITIQEMGHSKTIPSAISSSVNKQANCFNYIAANLPNKTH